MSSAMNTLVSAFQDINNEVPFNPEWKNGTGYFDHVTTDKTITFDANGYAKTEDDQGRKIILVKTDLGNVAVFQRYAGEDEKVVVTNMPCSLSKMLLIHGSLSEEQVESLIGTPRYPTAVKNVGARIQDLTKYLK